MIDDEPDSERVSALAPFSHGIFRAVWSASLVSNFGGLIQGVGAAWMMTTIATSSYQVALVQASTTLPIMLFALVAGAIADSFNRRKVMLVAQTFMLVVSALLTLFTWFGLITPWTLLAFTFLIDSGTALNSPSWQASVGDMVPRSKVPAAVALNSMGFNLTRSVGPAIGGVIVAAAGAAAAFAANALSYIGLIIVLFRWKPEIPAQTLPRETLGAAMGAGLRYVAMSPNIGKVLVRGSAFGFSAGAVLALLPLVARDVVKGDALTYGIMLGAFGIGAVGGALISVRLRQLLSSETMVRMAFGGSPSAPSTPPSAFTPGRPLSACSSAAPAGCSRCRISTSRCRCRHRAGWSAGCSRSTRRRPSAASRWAAGSGASSPTRMAPRPR